MALETEPQAFAQTAEHHRSTPVATFAERLRTGGTESPVFGAFDATGMIGMAGLYREPDGPRETGRIWGVFVLPGARGSGAGRGLIQAILQYARSLEWIREVRLEFAETQEAARRLYVSCGFRPAGTGAHGGVEMAVAIPRA